MVWVDPISKTNLKLEKKIEPVEEYISTFQWNTMKYRTDKSLQEITATLNQVTFKATKMKLSWYTLF